MCERGARCLRPLARAIQGLRINHTGAEKNIGFYEKCGYEVKEVSMSKYLDH